MNNEFNIPVVLLVFKRFDKVKEIINVLRVDKPRKIYVLSDGPRNEEEAILVNKTRKTIEESIDWECEIIKRYSDENIGVYGNIGLGAMWVFEREEKAIFLEDDNLPANTFLKYCDQMLTDYESHNQVLWVCGTNYLGEYTNATNDSYFYTKHLLPCGWASWSNKFLEYYDNELKGIDDPLKKNIVEASYNSHRLAKQRLYHMTSERKLLLNRQVPSSWDHQMEFSVRANDMYGISPSKNQIQNIGVDEHSIHSGHSKKNIMVDRFTSMSKYDLEFPLKKPNELKIDKLYEDKISKIRTYPLSIELKLIIARRIRRLFNIPTDKGTKKYLKERFIRKK